MAIATHLLKVSIAIENGEAIERQPLISGPDQRRGCNRRFTSGGQETGLAIAIGGDLRLSEDRRIAGKRTNGIESGGGEKGMRSQSGGGCD